VVNPQEAGGQTKLTSSDILQALITQELAAIRQDVAQKLRQHSGADCRGLEKEVSTLQNLTLCINLM
jgi:hypothetical protein